MFEILMMADLRNERREGNSSINSAVNQDDVARRRIYKPVINGYHSAWRFDAGIYDRLPSRRRPPNTQGPKPGQKR